jgi:hypothetical protein
MEFALLSAVTCDVHRNWLSDSGFLEILRCGSRSSQFAVVVKSPAEVNLCLYIERLLTDLGEVRYKLCAHDAVECFCKFRANRIREGRTFLLGVNGSTGTRVLCNRIDTSMKYT